MLSGDQPPESLCCAALVEDGLSSHGFGTQGPYVGNGGSGSRAGGYPVLEVRMRRFLGVDGREWEVVVGRESWGTVVAIFVPREGGDPPRQTLLDVTSTEDALRALQAASEAELRLLLDRSTMKTME
jgi:hypothetical protein